MFLKNFFKPKNQSTVTTRDLYLDALANQTSAASQVSSVFTCVRILSDTIAQLPCKLMEQTGSTKLPATDNSLYSLMLFAPNMNMTAYDFWKYNASCLLYKGFYLSYVIRGFGNEIIEMIAIQPDSVSKIEKRKDGRLTFTINVKVNGQSQPKILIGGIDCHYCFYSTSDGVQPISPISENKRTIGLAATAELHGEKVFKNDATPPLVIHSPGEITQAAAIRLAKSWRDGSTGGNYGVPRVLEGGYTIEKLSMSNEDAQYLQTREFQSEQIAGIFGVPPHMLGSTKQAKGWSTMEQLMNELVSLGVNPLVRRIEQSIRRDLIDKRFWIGNVSLYANFGTNALLRGDTKTRSEFYQKMQQLGALNSNEVRSFEDLNPRTDDSADKYWEPAGSNFQLEGTIENEEE
jgi:HK97 family phage portal protein